MLAYMGSAPPTNVHNNLPSVGLRRILAPAVYLFIICRLPPHVTLRRASLHVSLHVLSIATVPVQWDRSIPSPLKMFQTVRGLLFPDGKLKGTSTAQLEELASRV